MTDQIFNFLAQAEASKPSGGLLSNTYVLTLMVAIISVVVAYLYRRAH